jgi:hypothetical protein
LKAIYNTLITDKRYLEFGNKKVIITAAIVDENEYAYHANVVLNNDTPFIEYYKNAKKYINNLYDEGYQIDKIPTFKVTV